jgi:hypothetical protein
MAKTIVQKVVFKNTAPAAIYDAYMNAKKHTVVTGAAADIKAKEGTSFSAHDGYITGENLKLVKDQLIVQRTKRHFYLFPNRTSSVCCCSYLFRSLSRHRTGGR